MLPIPGISALLLKGATSEMNQQKNVFSDRKPTANTKKTRHEMLGIQIKNGFSKVSACSLAVSFQVGGNSVRYQ